MNENEPKDLEHKIEVVLGKTTLAPPSPLRLWLDHVSDTAVVLVGRRQGHERTLLSLNLRTGWFRRVGCAAADLRLPADKQGRVLFGDEFDAVETADLRRRVDEAIEVLKTVDQVYIKLDRCALAKCLREAKKAGKT